MDEYFLMLKLIGSLVVVALLAYLAIKFGVRRLQPRIGPGYIRVIQRVPLDLKSGTTLLLVAAGEKILLLGASPQNVTILKELPADTFELPTEGQSGVFSRVLCAYQERMKSGKEGL